MPSFATPEPLTVASTTAGARVRVAASERSDTVAGYAVKPGPTTNTAEELLGRPALNFADRAHDNAAAFHG